MKLKVELLKENQNETLSKFYIDGRLRGYIIEDEKREVKVHGETRIPAGIYKVILRKEGTKHLQYAQKFPSFHRGMLWLQDVPGFQFILIHIGNSDKDTEGCLCGGLNHEERNGKLMVTQSTVWYTQVYQEISRAILNGENVEIEITR